MKTLLFGLGSGKNTVYLNIKALLLGEIIAKQTPHIYIFCPNQEIGMMLYGMSENIKRMKSSVSNKNGNCG